MKALDEKCFLFDLKALFSLKIFKFLSRIFGHVKNRSLVTLIRLILNFMTAQPGYKTHIAQYLTK